MKKTADKTRRKIAKLDAALKDRTSLLIIVQDFPDPDAIASAAALREYARRRHSLTCTIGFGGVVGRMENRALLNYLDLPLRSFDRFDPAEFDAVAMVDTQPGTGNNSLPSSVAPRIVIDHHPCRKLTRLAEFTDIRRRYGATSTILYEYLRAAKQALSPPLATALLYGIRSDTQELGRESTQYDLEASLELYRLANIRMYHSIRQARVPTSYFRLISTALRTTRECGSALVSLPGEIETPDQIGEVAELLLRHEACSWALCIGWYGNRALLSLRTSVAGADAGQVMQRLVSRTGTGGGHRAMAGGQIPLPQDGDRRRIEERLLQRVARITRQPAPLVFEPLL